jgi:16S rRNA processing protein RimM
LKRIALAAVAGAHGVKGELRLKLFTESIEKLKRYENVYVAGVERKVESVRAGSSGAIARLSGIGDRSAAEALRGSVIEVDRSALPPLEPGEYYHADLIGLACFDREGRELGRVIGIENYGAGDLLEVEATDGVHSLIPFRPGIAEQDGDRIVLDPEFLA